MTITNATIDIEQIRAETPGCNNVIHFNNAGASLMPSPVLNTVVDYLNLEAQIGGYEAAEKKQDELESVYNSASKLIGAKKEEIAIVENATRAWDMAFYSISFKKGDKILTTISEYASNYIAFLQVSKKTGVKIEVISNDEFGQISIDALKNAIDDKVKLIAINHIPTNSGLVNPAKEVGKIARQANVLYLLDACQSVGQIPIDVNEIGCDILSATSRKFLRGPRGVGFLYVKQELINKLEPVFLDLHAAEWIEKDKYKIRNDARRFENWERNYAGKIGLGKAIGYASNLGLNVIWERILMLSNMLRNQLGSIPSIKICDQGKTKCGIVTFTINGKGSKEIVKLLLKQKINVSSSATNSALIDMQSRGLPDLVRASVHYYNTEEEIEKLCSVIKSIT